MKTYIRWIRWNGKQMAAHPVKWVIAATLFNLTLMFGWGAVEKKSRKL